LLQLASSGRTGTDFLDSKYLEITANKLKLIIFGGKSVQMMVFGATMHHFNASPLDPWQPRLAQGPSDGAAHQTGWFTAL
jgi:hypothetical protein